MQYTAPQEFAPLKPVPHCLSPEEYVTLLHPVDCIGKPGLLTLPVGENPVSWLFDSEVLCAQLNTYLYSPSYVSLNRFKGKRANKNLVALNAVYVDLDFFKMLAWRGKSPSVVQAAYSDHLRRQNLPQPSLYVHSGRGLYAIWLIQEMPARAKPRWQAIQKALVGLSSKFGADPVCVDEARVFRIPGSINQKCGRKVQVSGGTLKRYRFDVLEGVIYRACGRPTRMELHERKANKVHNHSLSSNKMPKGLTQKKRHQILLDDLEIYRFYLGGHIPEGQRNIFLHLYAICLTHILPPACIESEITAMADLATPGMKPGEVKTIINQAVKKAAGPKLMRIGKDGRYTYRGHTFCEKLEISAELSRELGLQQMIPDEERRRRKAANQQAKERAKGRVPRKEYEENSAARSKPWEKYGLKRSQYYARRKAGTLPDIPST